jgi:hypothetical protein
MAKKSASKKAEPIAARPARPISSTPVRQTPIPKAVKSANGGGIAAPTSDQIAKRAYELYASGAPGSEADHWFQAERELRTGA